MKKRSVAFMLVTAMAATAMAPAAVYADEAKEVFVLADDEWYGTDLYQQDSWTSGQGLSADPLFTLDPDGGDL